MIPFFSKSDRYTPTKVLTSAGIPWERGSTSSHHEFATDTVLGWKTGLDASPVLLTDDYMKNKAGRNMLTKTEISFPDVKLTERFSNTSD